MRVLLIILVGTAIAVGAVGVWRWQSERNLIRRHVLLEFREGEKLLAILYLDHADTGLMDVSFSGNEVDVTLLRRWGDRAAAYAVRGATGLVFGDAQIAVAADGVTVNGREYPLSTMIISRDGDVILNAFVRTFD